MDLHIAFGIAVSSFAFGGLLGYFCCATELLSVYRRYNRLQERHTKLSEAVRKSVRTHTYRDERGKFKKVDVNGYSKEPTDDVDS